MEFNPVQTNQMPSHLKLKNAAWKVVNNTLFRFSPSHFAFFRKWRVLLVRAFGGKIDWNASMHPSAIIDYPWNLIMASRSSLGEKCWVYAMDSISIGEFSCIGKDVYLLTGSHDLEKPTFDLITRPIIIGNGCWISTGSIILPGVGIGNYNYSVVAAGSVVCKSIENETVVGGNPAKFIKKRVIKDA